MDQYTIVDQTNTKNSRAQHILYCGLDANEYNRISGCDTAKCILEQVDSHLWKDKLSSRYKNELVCTLVWTIQDAVMNPFKTCWLNLATSPTTWSVLARPRLIKKCWERSFSVSQRTSGAQRSQQ